MTLDVQLAPSTSRASQARKSTRVKIEVCSTVKEPKTQLKHLLPRTADLSSYQLISKGIRLLDSEMLGNLNIQDGALLQLAPIPDTGILLHLQNDHGAYFDARVKPSMTVKERRSTSSIHRLLSKSTEELSLFYFLFYLSQQSRSWSNKRETILFLTKFFASQRSNLRTMLPLPLIN